MDTSMLSVGIDIGTSTTSMVVSRLHVRNTASCFSVPRVAITGAEIVYRGEIYQTPQAGATASTQTRLPPSWRRSTAGRASRRSRYRPARSSLPANPPARRTPPW